MLFTLSHTGLKRAFFIFYWLLIPKLQYFDGLRQLNML
jgi:hypothetical protein